MQNHNIITKNNRNLLYKIVTFQPNARQQESAFGGYYFMLDSRLRGNDKTHAALG
jgi:hypothetical protein